MQRRMRKIPLHQIQNPPLISCYRHLRLGTHRCLQKQPSGVQNASSMSLQDQRHVSVRQRFRRYLQHGPRASIHHAFQSFAKPAMCYARHTAKHFFTAFLGRKNTKINGRSSLQRLLEVVKTFLEIFWVPRVARCREESIQTMESDLHGIKPQLQHLLLILSRGRDLPYLSIKFLICKRAHPHLPCRPVWELVH